MWQLNRVKLTNWQSFKEQEYLFKKGIPVLIVGSNQTDDSAESNGSGKSALEESINYSLTGNSIRKVRDVKLINYDADTAEIELEIINTISNNLMLIKRQLSRNETGKVQIYINRIDQKDKFSSVTEANKFIIQQLGISVEDLQNYFIISKEKYVSFFSSSDRDKKALIGRFSNADTILGVEELVQVDIDKLIKANNDCKLEYAQLEAKKEVYSEQLLQFEDSIINEKRQIEIDKVNEKIEGHKILINKYTENIEEYEKIIKIKESEIIVLDAQIKENKTILSNFKAEDFTKDIEKLNSDKQSYNEKLAEIKKDKKELSDSLDEFTVFLREIQNNIAGSIQCPKCFHEFVLGEEVDVKELKESVPEVESSIEEVKDSILNIKNRESDIELNIEQLDKLLIDFKNKIQTNLDQKTVISKRIAQLESSKESMEQYIKRNNKLIVDLESDIKSTNKKIDTFKLDIEEIKKKSYNDNKEEFEDKIKDVNISIAACKKTIETNDEEIQKLNQWIFNFKKFYSYLANKSLSIIEGYANLYLSKMGTNLQMKIEGYKTLANGKIKENITPIILRNGIIEGEFNQFSGGEKAKLDFSLVLTNQQLINLNSTSGGLDLLWVDEILESVDGMGIRCLLDSTKDLNKSIFLTTHVDHSKIQENSIIVEKVNGVSKILN